MATESAAMVSTRRITRQLVVLWLLWAAADIGSCRDVSFVRGVNWGQPRSNKIWVNVRHRRAPSQEGSDAEARKLTQTMKEAKSAQELVETILVGVDGPFFNHFHASCAYHRLATWQRRGQLPKTAASVGLPKLNTRVQEMISDGLLNAQALANVLWSIAYLFDDFPDVLKVVPAIVAQVPAMAKEMIPQHLSNILWASANLKDDVPDVLDIVPAMVAQILAKAKELKPQELSNILWASANLKDNAPDVLDVVPAIVPQIPLQAKDMIPQHLANILWASAKLKDAAPDVLDVVPAIVAQIPLQAKDMIPQHLANILWASANLKDDAPDVLDIVPAIVAQIPAKAKELKPQELSNILWASAKLKDDAPEALAIVPAIVAQIPTKAKDLKPQELSNIIWASANLKGDAPDVLDVVPAIVAQIPAKAKDMNPQELSSSLVALVHLQESVPAARAFLADKVGTGVTFPRQAASRVANQMRSLSGSDLFLAVPRVVWACAKIGSTHDELVSTVATQLGSSKKVSRLSAWSLCSLYGSYQLLGQAERFDDFTELLKTELRRRGLSESDVGRSLEGPLPWSQANK